MFKTLPIHLKIFINRVVVINLETDKEVEKKAEIAFSSNRQLVSDFPKAEHAIKAAMKELKPPAFRNYHILIQAMEMYEGGLSEIEKRALQDVAEQCGGAVVIVEDGSKTFSRSDAKSMLLARKRPWFRW